MNRRASVATFAIASVGIALLAGVADAQHTWTATASAPWSLPANWLGGNAPPAGGGAGVTLTFGNSGAFAWTATNDLGNPFVLNGFTLDSLSSGLGTIAGSTLQFNGAGALLSNTGTGNWTISNPIDLASDLTLGGVGGTGPGTTTLTGAITGAGALILGGPQASNNLTNIYQIGALGASSAINSYSGGTILNSGTLMLANTSALPPGTGTPLGTGQVIVNGGSFGSPIGSVYVPNDFVLNSNLNIANSGFIYLTGVLSGPGGLNARNQGSAQPTPAMVEIRNHCTYTGPTNLQSTTLHTALGGIFGNSTLSAPRVLINNQGSILGSSAITVGAGGALLLDNTTAAEQRISGVAPVTLKSAELALTGNATTAVNQLVGPVTASGYSTLTVTPTAGAGAQMSVASLSRTLRGAIFARGNNIAAAPGPGNSNIYVTSPPAMVGGGGADGTTTISIIPFVVGSPFSGGQANATDLVTYGTNGIRLLTPSEYAGALGGNANDNVRLIAGTNNDATHTVNALVTEGHVNGTGTINITSGVWLTSPPTNTPQTMVNNIDFGVAEGHIIIAGTNAAALTMGGRISGSNGVTKSGYGTMTLTNPTNNFSGPITINAGVLSFADTAVLGSSNQIVFTYNGNVFPQFQFTGASATFPQSVIANGGHFRLSSTSGGASMTFDGVISGDGGVQTLASGAGASITFTGNNTYLGGTRIANGDLVFSSDANLGNPAGGIDLGTAAANEGIKLTGNWITGRPMHISLVAGINTQANSATLNGVISGNSAITKAGAGTLALNADNTYTGAITVGGGTLAVNGATIAPVTINGACTLAGSGRVGAATLNATGKIAPGNSAGTLTATSLTWNGGGTMDFELGSPGSNQDRLDLVGALTKGTAGAYQFDFTTLPAFASGTYTLINFGSNSGFSESDFTFTGPGGLQGEFVLRGNQLQFATPSACPADVAPPGGDGAVDVNDLLAVITTWGPCPIPPDACDADIDFSGAVDVNDLLAVISTWGACP